MIFFCKKAFTVTFVHFNVSLLNKSINFFLKISYRPQFLNDSLSIKAYMQIHAFLDIVYKSTLILPTY